MWKWWSPLNPAASWVMAQHWGGLHAITALFHNWLVSQRARTCQHAGRQEGRQAGRMRLQHLPQAGMGMFLRVALHAEQHILSVEKMWMSPCVSVFVCAWTAVSWTSCIWHCVHLLFLFLHATVCQMYFAFSSSYEPLFHPTVSNGGMLISTFQISVLHFIPLTFFDSYNTSVSDLESLGRNVK